MALGNAFTPDVLTWFETGLRLGAATFLPLLIGLERYLNNKPIDFRPFIIISVGACGLLIASIEMLESTADPQSRIDPTRVIEGVITGIGFLGAGAMFREGNFIQGAGSAAAIWSAGAIGLACGMGELWLAGLVTAIVLVTLVASRPFTDKWDAHEGGEEKTRRDTRN
ncbi:MgtC/SapB family protein [Qipengyuania sp. CAU 1752]